MSLTSDLHIWIGLTDISEKGYWDYFDDSDGLPIFCQEVGLDWLDQDFMGYYFDLNKERNLDFIIQKTPESGFYEIIKNDCIKKGVLNANAMFYYWGMDLLNIDKDITYNTLKYIGSYKWEWD